jgi:hypothetical protein
VAFNALRSLGEGKLGEEMTKLAEQSDLEGTQLLEAVKSARLQFYASRDEDD